MNFSHPDYPYYLALVIIGAAIGYIAQLQGGNIILLVGGVLVELFIGYRSHDQRTAMLAGAFFAVIAVTANSPIINGYYVGHGDPMATLFFPYVAHVVLAAIAGGVIATLSNIVLRKR